MIEAKIIPYQLLVTGHAGYAEAGKDIVCAAVSVLTVTLAEKLREIEQLHGLRDPPIIRMEDGQAEILCNPTEVAEPMVSLLFDTVRTGLSLVAEEYPEWMRLE